MTRVLIVTTNFWPEPTGTAPFATDLVIALQNQGISIDTLTTYPHYPWWSLPDHYRQLQNPARDDVGNSVIRVLHYIPKSSKLFTRFLYELSLIRNLICAIRKFDFSQIECVVTIGSSLAGHFVGKFLSKRNKVPLLIIVHDLVGKGLEQSGIPAGRIIAKYVQKLELNNLKSATAVAVISPLMKRVVEEMRVDSAKIALLPLYSPKEITELDSLSAKIEMGWDPNKFAIVHSGNMGTKQNLETVIEAARLLVSDSELVFYLVGHGNQEDSLKVRAKGLKNLFFLPATSDEDFPKVLAAADLLLVCERASQLEMSLPSKLASYFFSNRPVIASIPIGGATAMYLQHMAQITPAENPKLLADEIVSLKKDKIKRQSLAATSLEYAKLNLTRDVGRQKYVEWILRVLKN